MIGPGSKDGSYMDFAQADVLERLEASDDAALDRLGFGVIGMSLAGVVERYNAVEAELAGLSASKVLGKHFFTEVAPCTNNYLVAQRFDDEPRLDATMPYVFTLRMRPTKVELRLLKVPLAARQYILVRRR